MELTIHQHCSDDHRTLLISNFFNTILLTYHNTTIIIGNLEECYTLLSSGAWVNYIDSAGYLAIHYACSTGCYEVVKLLLEFGSDHSSFLTGKVYLSIHRRSVVVAVAVVVCYVKCCHVCSLFC
jgi:hypothetical protein